MRGALPVVVACLAVLVGTAASASGRPMPPREIRTTDDESLARAVSQLVDSGGVIRLAGEKYRVLEVYARPSTAGRLYVIGEGRPIVEHVLLSNTARVTLSGLRIAPISRDATLEIRDSRAITMEKLVVSAAGTAHSASIVVSGEGVSPCGAANSRSAAIGRPCARTA